MKMGKDKDAGQQQLPRQWPPKFGEGTTTRPFVSRTSSSNGERAEEIAVMGNRSERENGILLFVGATRWQRKLEAEKEWHPQKCCAEMRTLF